MKLRNYIATLFRMAWRGKDKSIIYQPKSIGGLGLYNMHTMNKTFIMKLG
jgi:hypothetical protein